MNYPGQGWLTRPGFRFTVEARYGTGMKAAKLLGVVIDFFCSAIARASAAPNPAHLWNRLHEALFSRIAPDGEQHGRAELDILFWGDTQHLLAQPSHDKAIRARRSSLPARNGLWSGG